MRQEYLISAIDEVQQYINENDYLHSHNQFLIALICQALLLPNLPRNKREEYCLIWINGIRDIINLGSFVFEYNFSVLLFSQINSDICDDVKHKIKRLMLDCIIYGNQGIISNQIVPNIRLFLLKNESIANSFFNTILLLAKNEKQKYASKHNSDSFFETKKEKIIDQYLIKNKGLVITNFDIEKYDIETIIHISNCGLTLNNSIYYNIIKAILDSIILLWKKPSTRFADELDVDSYCELVGLFSSEIKDNLGKTSHIYDLLFDGFDFSGFSDDMVEFYQDVFNVLPSLFFDAYNNKTMREACKSSVMQLENKINEISCKDFQYHLYKLLTLSANPNKLGNWGNCQTEYSYSDKQFLNELITKYGKYHLEDLLLTIYQLHIDKLLPEILISLNRAIMDAKEMDINYEPILKKGAGIVLCIISEAFLKHSDAIKSDRELTEAYESILTILVDVRFECAAVVLDEFRIH